MNNLAGPAKTKPILPAVRLAGLSASGGRPVFSLLLSPYSLLLAPPFFSCFCTAIYGTISPPAHSLPISPHQNPPIFRQNLRNFSNFLHISPTYSSAVSPLLVSFVQSFVSFPTFKHFSRHSTLVFNSKFNTQNSKFPSHFSLPTFFPPPPKSPQESTFPT